MVCGSVPHSRVTSSVSRYPHFLRVIFERPTPDLNLLRHFHSAQLESAPGGSTSLALMDMVVVVGRLSSLSSHKAALVFSAPLGSTSLRKLFLDLSLDTGVTAAPVSAKILAQIPLTQLCNT